MYSARNVNAWAYRHASEQACDRNDICATLPARESTVPGVGGILNNRLSDFDLSGRTGWMFISIKNRCFDRPYVKRFIEMCERLGVEGRICPVDAPYRYNRMAELGIDVLPEEEALKIERLSSDISRMVQKALNGARTRRVDLVRWGDLERETPARYRAELTAAFKARSRIRDVILDQVASVKALESERMFERFAEFFLCEVPVLMHTYYGRGPTFDIYPGPQPKLLWSIELGFHEDELPLLTALTRKERSMLYVDTHNRRATRH